MEYRLFRLFREVTTAMACGAELSVNDTAFVERFPCSKAELHDTAVSDDDQRRIAAIHKHVWPALSQELTQNKG